MAVSCDSSDLLFKDVNIVLEHNESEDMLNRTITNLQEEVAALISKQQSVDQKRRDVLDKLIELKGSIRVFCRVRPSHVIDNWNVKSPISLEQEKIVIRSTGGKKEFQVDRVFVEESTQEDVFCEVKPILRSALDGHNVCILAYGQTGTGKTYTMEGTKLNPGIGPRAMEELFYQVSEHKSAIYSFSISMLEVYMGSLKDLLAPKKPSCRSMELNPEGNLSILAGKNGRVEIEGLMDVAVTDLREANLWYYRGRRARSTSVTNVNESSSRSHCLTRITVRRVGEADRVVSKLWLVDLGGSERLLKTGAVGLTMDEGRAINLSLSALGDVIYALQRKLHHVPYRNSKLTQILSDSLGDGSKALIVVHISPHMDDVGETICSLSFAKRARSIESSKELSEDKKKQKQMRTHALEQQIHEGEVEIRALRNQIENIQNAIQEKKLSSQIDRARNDQKGSPRSTLVVDQIDVEESPEFADSATAQRALHGSVPHFMIPTVSSRQRHFASHEIIGKSRSMRLTNRAPMDSLRSQSFMSSVNFNSSGKPKSFDTNLPKSKNVSLYSRREKGSQAVDTKVMIQVVQDKKIPGPHIGMRNASLHYNHRRRMSDFT